jgi:hypothetical protein
MKSIKRNLILFTTTLFVVLVTLSSCGKKGCTDSNATNYCDECKKDDGSCTYKASVQFWYNQTLLVLQLLVFTLIVIQIVLKTEL